MKSLINIISELSYLMGQMEETAKEQFNLTSLTYIQMNYLEVISSLENPNITELSVQMNLSKPTVKVAVDKLIEKDFIYKVRSDSDRRSVHLHLTEKGNLINQMHYYAHKRIVELFNRKLDNKEIETITGLLDKVLSDN